MINWNIYIKGKIIQFTGLAISLVVIILCSYFDKFNLIVFVAPFLLTSIISVIYTNKYCKCPHCKKGILNLPYYQEIRHEIEIYKKDSFTCPYCETEIKVINRHK